MSIEIRGDQAILAEILRDSGRDIDEAARLFKEVYDYESKVLGSQDPTVLLIASEHARCLEIKGSTVKALKIYKEAYPIILKTFGENDTDVQKVRGWIEAARKTDESKHQLL